MERGSRAKAERTRQTLSRELEELGERLEESGNATATQVQFNIQISSLQVKRIDSIFVLKFNQNLFFSKRNLYCPNLIQIELNRKRESELAKLKEELDNSSLHHETALATLRQKHNAVIADLAEQIDSLNKAKAK